MKPRIDIRLVILAAVLACACEQGQEFGGADCVPVDHDASVWFTDVDRDGMPTEPIVGRPVPRIGRRVGCTESMKLPDLESCSAPDDLANCWNPFSAGQEPPMDGVPTWYGRVHGECACLLDDAGSW